MDPSKLTQQDFQVIRDILPTILKQSEQILWGWGVRVMGGGER